MGLLQPYSLQIVGLLSLVGVSALGEAVGLVFLAALLNVLLISGGELSGPTFFGPIYDYAENNTILFLLFLGLTYIVKTLLALWATYASYALATGVLTRNEQARCELLRHRRQYIEQFLVASDGRASQRVADLVEHLGAGKEPSSFIPTIGNSLLV